MKMKAFARGIVSVVSIFTRERKPVEHIKQMPLASRQRTDQEAIRGDFCAIGNDLEEARKCYDETDI